jgi:hypothetical protein
MDGIYEINRSDSLRWHDIRTKFHGYWLGNSSNTKVIISKTWEAAVLVLLTEGIYEVRCWDDLRCHEKRTKFYDNRFRHSINITIIAWTIWEAVVLVLLMGGIYDVCHLDGPRRHDIHTKYHGYPFVSTNERDLLSTPLRWTRVAWFTHQVSWLPVQEFK